MKTISVFLLSIFLIPLYTYGADTCGAGGGPILSVNDTFGPVTAAVDYIYYDYLDAQNNVVNGFVANCQSGPPISTCLDDPGSGIQPGAVNGACDFFNNDSCPTITKCDGEAGGVTSADRVVFVLLDPTNEPGTNHSLDFSMTTVAGTAGGGGSYLLSDAPPASGVHPRAALPAPAITSATCASGSCVVGLSITNPTFNSGGTTGGLYGDDAGSGAGSMSANLVAGYKIYALQVASAPTSGCTLTTWQGCSAQTPWSAALVTAGQYIPKSAVATSTGTVTVTANTSSSDRLYLSYALVFNHNGACPTGGCSAAQVQGIDTLDADMVSPFVTANSIPIAPNPVKFVSFTGKWKGSKVTLTWVTASEIDTVGFDLYRMDLAADEGNTGNDQAPSAPSDWVKVNAAVIPSLSQGGSGATYTYIDKHSGSKAQYRLKEVPLSNTPPDTIETTVTKKK